MASGSSTGEISVNSNATLFPEIIQLWGTGQDFLFQGTPGSATVTADQPATVSLSLQPESGSAQQVTFSCSGTPTGSNCSFSPSTLSVDGIHSATTTMTLLRPAALLLALSKATYVAGDDSSISGLSRR